MTWRNRIEASGKPGVVTGGQGYAVDYDNVNRLTASNYYTQTGGTFTPSATDAFNEKVLGYDEMGNINRLDHSDKTGAALNSLYYTYGTNGNKLTSIVDNVLHLKSGTYSYDGNGNMITDTYSGITVSYNYLDLPDTVKNGSDKLVFTYDAAGNKLYQMLYIGGNLISQRHYIEDAIVTANPSIPVNGKIESIAMAEGRVVNTGTGGYKYEYNLQDHQFNNRVNFRVDHDGTVNLSQVRNYYPFGEMMGDSTMNYALTPVDLFQYSGKELQPGLDLNTYDFGARNYDPVLGRWWSMDPLAVSFEDESPYGYVGDNPLNMIDPDGMHYIFGGGDGRNLVQTPGPTGDGIPWKPIGQGLVGASALWEGYQAFKAFSLSYSRIEDFSTIGKLQGNVIRPQVPIAVRSSIPQISKPKSFVKIKNTRPFSNLTRYDPGTIKSWPPPDQVNYQDFGLPSTSLAIGTNVMETYGAVDGAFAIKSLFTTVKIGLETRFIVGVDGIIHDMTPTLERIETGGSFPHRNDGSIFLNREGLLPKEAPGFYREFVHETPGSMKPGAMRIITGRNGKVWFSPDHYRTFIQIK